MRKGTGGHLERSAVENGDGSGGRGARRNSAGVSWDWREESVGSWEGVREKTVIRKKKKTQKGKQWKHGYYS